MCRETFILLLSWADQGQVRGSLLISLHFTSLCTITSHHPLVPRYRNSGSPTSFARMAPPPALLTQFPAPFAEPSMTPAQSPFPHVPCWLKSASLSPHRWVPSHWCLFHLPPCVLPPLSWMTSWLLIHSSAQISVFIYLPFHYTVFEIPSTSRTRAGSFLKSCQFWGAKRYPHDSFFHSVKISSLPMMCGGTVL